MILFSPVCFEHTSFRLVSSCSKSVITVLVQLNVGSVRKLMGGFSLHPLNIVIKWGLTDLEHILQSFPVSCVFF